MTDAPTPSLTNPNPKREDEATETELRHALFRLKTECEVEGLDLKPGFDAWVSWANKLLGDFRPAASARPSPGDPVRATGTQTVPDRMSVAYWHRLQADELQQRAGENDTAWIMRLRQHFASSESEEEEA